MPVQLEKLFTKKTPPSAQSSSHSKTLSWEARVPMLTNPLFMLDTVMAFFIAWLLPSVVAIALLTLTGYGLDRIFSVVAWFGMGVGLLAAISFFMILIRFGNAYYARYTISAAGIACETTPDAPEIHSGLLFGCKAVSVPAGSMVSVKTEKWVEWDKIRRIKRIPTLRAVTLSDSFLPVIRIFCPDDATFFRAWEICKENAGAVDPGTPI
jgi:hypothetical protein